MAEGEGEKSRYNEAVHAINRLHLLWVKCHQVTEHGNADLLKWKYLLDSIWRELYSDVCRQPEKKQQKWKEENEQLRRQINEAGNEKKTLYETLNDRHLFLRRVQDKVGKGGSWEDAMESQL